MYSLGYIGRRWAGLSLSALGGGHQRGNGLTTPEPSGVPTGGTHGQPRTQRPRQHSGVVLACLMSCSMRKGTC
jgi:hypothetical protein